MFWKRNSYQVALREPETKGGKFTLSRAARAQGAHPAVAELHSNLINTLISLLYLCI